MKKRLQPPFKDISLRRVISRRFLLLWRNCKNAKWILFAKRADGAYFASLRDRMKWFPVCYIVLYIVLSVYIYIYIRIYVYVYILRTYRRHFKRSHRTIQIVTRIQCWNWFQFMSTSSLCSSRWWQPGICLHRANGETWKSLGQFVTLYRTDWYWKIAAGLVNYFPTIIKAMIF